MSVSHLCFIPIFTLTFQVDYFLQQSFNSVSQCDNILITGSRANVKKVIKKLCLIFADCLYSGYEYIWQLDSCIMFYYSHLTWSDSKLRCVNDNGNLLTIETARKEYILLPFLMEKFGTYNIIDIK